MSTSPQAAHDLGKKLAETNKPLPVPSTQTTWQVNNAIATGHKEGKSGK
jgi:hypothetical protein